MVLNELYSAGECMNAYTLVLSLFNCDQSVLCVGSSLIEEVLTSHWELLDKNDQAKTKNNVFFTRLLYNY